MINSYSKRQFFYLFILLAFILSFFLNAPQCYPQSDELITESKQNGEPPFEKNKRQEDTNTPKDKKEAGVPFENILKQEILSDKTTLQGDDYFYNPVGKRDPFYSKILEEKKDESKVLKRVGLQKYEISELTFVGIVNDASGKKGVIETPEGKSYIIKIGSLIGKKDGSVKDITNKEVVIQEVTYDYLGNKLQKTSTLKLNFIEKEEN